MRKSIFHYLKKYSYLFGIFLFIIILTKIDVGSILVSIKNVKISYLFLAVLLSFPVLLTKSYCWNYLKKKQNINYSQKDSFLMYGVGLYIGSVTPGRVGEVSRILYLTKDGHSLGKSLVSLILDRISDFVFLLVFIFFGLFFFFDLINKQTLILLVIAIFLIILIFISLKLNLTKFIIKKIFHFLVPDRYKKSLKVNFRDFVKDIKIYNFKDYLIVFLITAFSWFFYYIQMYVVAQSANITNIPILHLSIILTVVGFITLIPISISGIGTRDAALIFLLTPFIITKEQIIIFSSLILLMYAFTALIGLACWLIKPVKFSKN